MGVVKLVDVAIIKVIVVGVMWIPGSVLIAAAIGNYSAAMATL